ncbi:MAG TPA: 30S ribosomal protein S11 [Rhizomicrobium sp.]|nr:30S ribosomal protein S11 [Rhizomicrobium sp.]
MAGADKGTEAKDVAVAHLKITSNNVTVSITNKKGDVLCWASAGSCGFKGARKSTFVAGLATAQRSAERARELGVSSVEVRLKGEGPGANGAIAGLEAGGLVVTGKP